MSALPLLAQRALTALQSAAAYRFLRGGGIPLGHTQLARLCWGASMAITALLAAAAPAWVCLLTGALAALALIDCGGHGEHQDLGRMKPGYTKDGKAYELLTWPFKRLFVIAWERWPRWAGELLDGAAMSWIGLCRGVATVPLVWFYDPVFALKIVAGFALQGVAYFIGYRVPLSLRGLTARSPEWGELLTGWAVAAPFLIPI